MNSVVIQRVVTFSAHCSSVHQRSTAGGRLRIVFLIQKYTRTRVQHTCAHLHSMILSVFILFCLALVR